MQQDSATTPCAPEAGPSAADPGAEPSLFGIDEAMERTGGRSTPAVSSAPEIGEPEEATGDGEFDWDGRDAEAVVVKRQAAIAVYPNPRGHIVIRREREWDEDEDAFVYVQPENAEAVAKALLEAAAEIRSWSRPGSRGTTPS